MPTRPMQKTAAARKPASKAGFVISEKSKAEMAAGKGTKSDFDKARLDLLPAEFVLQALSYSDWRNEHIKHMLESAFEFWGGGDNDNLTDAALACQYALGFSASSHDFPCEQFLTLQGEILTGGAQKYSDRNWENGMRWGRMFAAFLRHTLAHLRGEINDPETGKPHLGHAGWNLMALYTHAVRKIGEDDRRVKKAAA